MNKFWIYNIKIILSDYLNLIPNINKNIINNLNIFSRLYFYLIIILILIKKNIKYIYISLLGLIIIIIFYFVKVHAIESDDDMNAIDKNKCSIPNKNNPYMNYVGDTSKIDSCYINDKKINKKILDYTEDSIFNYIYDSYYKNKFDRFFYTKPHNTFMLNHNNIGKWSYKST